MKFTFPILLVTAFLFSGTANAQGKKIKTIAGTGIGAFSGDGSASTGAELHAPISVAVDPTGNVYICDRLNNRIRKIFTSGVIVTIAGNGGLGNSGDGSIGTSAEVRPYGMTLDNSNNVYIADAAYHRIRKVNASGIISTFGGTGVLGSTGDGGPVSAATFITPCGMTFDTAGNMYICDGMANVVRKVNKAGIISRFAGNDTAGFAGDMGLAIEARVDSPYSVAADRKGNVYISDMINNRIRKVDAMGIISTYAGTGTHGYAGDGGMAVMAELNRPAGLATDTLGNLYFADADNDVIRKIDTDGVITTVVGNGTPGFGGDLGSVDGCNLHTPFGVAIDKYGEIFIADANNQRIRATYTPVSVADVNAQATIAVYPNPVADMLSVSGIDKNDVITIADIAGRVVSTSVQSTAAADAIVNTAALVPGMYLLRVSNAAGSSKGVVRLIKE
jgi:trimeric autotransporter adhesin